ncbi:NAD(P)/FAD-dependent oxidoreductase [Amycolatopsis sp. 195334CR]|uniref:NAD(P)/FAD-dependent oxidoreductase n=1 Tax=Amycolatopsis sp. 195334CR TaxID=2814588 RepID=UPI001A8C0A99|nr:FAD-dependent oxidoreductase [Amycolatopsis sp. 195334CR]MBN6033514.1 FAD-dependent oxidoreductase [Amycolatopsis sp. 195334CR]
MSEPQRIVIIGGGLAGAGAAAALRERGYPGEVLLFGADAHRPYELPALSKGLLIGDAEEPDWVRDQNFYTEHDVALHLGTRVTRIELGARLVLDAAGGEHRYDRLLLATGSKPRSLPVRGADLTGIHTLRTLDDALALRAAFAKADRVVIVGSGWIGSEAAAAARKHGAEVTVVGMETTPLESVLGPEVGGVFRDLHTEQGVRWRLGTSVADFVGDEGAVTGVRLTDGSVLEADVVLVAVGAAPETGLAHAAGLDLSEDGGVCVDAFLRTAAPDIYAAGDVASQFHPKYDRRIRVEHWANAKNQGEHAAANMLGDHEPYQRAPYFFSDQYDLGCEYRGLANLDTDRLVVRGDLAGREFLAFWLNENRVTAAMNVNIWDSGDALKHLVDTGTPVTDDQLLQGDLSAIA